MARLRITHSLLAVLFASIPRIHAQNLVPNGSFGVLTEDCALGAGGYPYLEYWRALNCGSGPGLLHACNNSLGNMSGVPYSASGYQQAHSGEAYLKTIPMFTNAQSGLPDTNPREFANVDLVAPLQAGQLYCLRLWINLVDSSCYKIDRFHARLDYSVPTLCADADTAWDTNATATFDISAVDTMNWTLLEAEFIANGGESNLTLGCFQRIDEVNATFLADHSSLYGALFAAYYVDDVELWACQVGIPERSALAFDLFPDPADAQTVLRFDGTASVRVLLLNNLGQSLSPSGWPTAPIVSGRHVLDTSALSSGQYVVQLVAQDGSRGARRLLVTH